MQDVPYAPYALTSLKAIRGDAALNVSYTID